MGTRHLIAVQIDGTYRVAQYGQWDGYPSGQGTAVLNFLQTVDLEAFKGKVRSTQWADDEYVKSLYEAEGIDISSGMIDYQKARQFSAKYPELSRDTGAGILDLIMESNQGIRVRDSIDFANDGLFCEWAYVIDLDNKTLEVYSGFKKDELAPTERFFRHDPNDTSEYSAVSLVKSYDLNALPDKKTFLQELEPQDKDVEV